MAIDAGHKRMLWGYAAGGVVLNFVLNGAAAWFLFPPVESLPVWARGNCVAGDTIGTSFFLPLTTCLVLTPIVRKALRAGKIQPIERSGLPKLIARLPGNFVARGAVVGLLCALTFALAALALVGALGFESLTRVDVTVFKAIYTALLGLVVTPLFGLRAFGDR